MQTLANFRNRLAHWEPLFSGTTGLVNQLTRIDELFQVLDPEVALWVGQRSKTLDLVRDIPEPLIRTPTGSYLGNS